MNNRVRYTTYEINREVFYQTPKFLFHGEFKKLNNDARMLYAILKDRHGLSMKNKWVNEDGEVYLKFPRAEMCETLGLSENTVMKAMNMLKKYQLVEEERIGLGQSNIIYLLYVTNTENPLNRKFCDSEHENFAEANTKNLQFPSINKTNFSVINQNQQESEITEEHNNIPTQENIPDNDMIDKQKENISEYVVADKICLDEIKSEYADRLDEINNLYKLICQILANQNPQAVVRISKKNTPIHEVQKVFSLIEKKHIEYVLSSLEKNGNRDKIKSNAKAYLLTALYHAPRTIEYYYDNISLTTPKKKPSDFDSEDFFEKVVRNTMKF